MPAVRSSCSLSLPYSCSFHNERREMNELRVMMIIIEANIMSYLYLVPSYFVPFLPF